MNITSELIISLIIAITGITSLIWSIIRERPRLKLETVSFEWLNKHQQGPFDRQWVSVNINLRNLSKRPTTLEDIYIYIGNQILTPDFFMPSEIDIAGSKSQSLGYTFNFENEKFKRLFNENKEITLGVMIIHTFGTIRSKSKTDFATGYLTFK